MSTYDDDHFLRPDIDYIMHNFENNPDEITQLICHQLETVYDPEFPLVDIFTLGLIYSIVVDPDEETIAIIMTYTTPSCPEGELIQQLMKNSISDKLPTYTIDIQVTFDPQRSLEMIRDQDLRRMFE
jgi:metal-sulfur cluster biosynthetic enzyme